MSGSPPVTFAWRGAFEDDEVNALHATAFGHSPLARPWRRQLDAHSLGWVTARRGAHLLGFVNVAWDGDQHAFLVDTAVAPDAQGAGVGEELVRLAVEGAQAAGCAWIHVDFEDALTHFYVDHCGFRPTPAGVLALAGG